MTTDTKTMGNEGAALFQSLFLGIKEGICRGVL